MSDHKERLEMLTNAHGYGAVLYQSDRESIRWALGRIAELEAEVERERHVRGTAERESWQHAERTAQLYIEREEREAKIAEQAATIERLRGALKVIEQIACGDSQVADDDTAGMTYIDTIAHAALAAQDSQEASA